MAGRCWLTIILTSLTLGCAHRTLPLEPRLPTQERLSELARVAPDDVPKEGPFSASVYPQVILAGHATWVSCHVPRSYRAGVLRLDVPWMGASEQELDLVQFKRLLERVPCGTHTISCSVFFYEGGSERRTATLIARGDCEDASGPTH